MRPYCALRYLILALIFLSHSPRIDAQAVPLPHQECIKLVPGDWGPNLGEQWHENEAVYWGCRLGIPRETVQFWQRSARVDGMIQDLIPVTIGKADLVLVEQMEGTAHCYTFTALVKTAAGWSEIWRLPSGEGFGNCTLKCPPVRMKIRGKNLILKFPYPSDRKKNASISCKSVKWRKESYSWDGQTFKQINIRVRMASASSAFARRPN